MFENKDHFNDDENRVKLNFGILSFIFQCNVAIQYAFIVLN